MKKIIAILFIVVASTINAQSLSQKFSVKDYADKQTQQIKSAFDLSETQTAEVFKANISKAHSIKKYLLLNEKRGNINGLNQKEAIKMVEEDAERASGYMQDIKRILGDSLFEEYLRKFK